MTAGRSYAGGLLLIPCLWLAAGCALENDGSRQKPQKDWDAVRGQIKLQIARDHLDAGRIADAQAQLEEVVRFEPASFEARILSARMCIARGELAAAREALDAAARIDPESHEVAYFRGVIAEWNADLRSALAEYARAVRLSPQMFVYISAEAEAQVALGYGELALRTLQLRQRDLAGNADLCELIGDVCTALQLYDEAVSHYREASLLEHGARSRQLQLGTALARADRYQEAATVLKPLVVEGTDVAWPHQQALARAYLELGQVSEAVELLRVATTADPLDPEPWSWLAMAWIRDGHYAAARQAAEEASKLKPSELEYKLLLGLICLRQHDHACLKTTLASLHGVAAGNRAAALLTAAAHDVTSSDEQPPIRVLRAVQCSESEPLVIHGAR